MRHLLCALLFLSLTYCSFSQSSKIKATKYPSLLWEIRSKGLTRPSYLFGTMHVSSKMVFNLSDSFYLGIKNAQVVALETNPGTWQEDFSRYDMGADAYRNLSRFGYGVYSAPQDYLTINSLKLGSYEKMMEAALYSSPSILNNFLYRSRSEYSSDFEEDTYLDLHIFQAGKKLGKKITGVEDFDGSMNLVKEAYADAAKEKNKKERGYDVDEDLSSRNLEAAYRSGNLDLLDTINKANSRSAAFDEKFLYKRNEIQAHSIDSILKKGTSLFVGVGAAHLPGQRGVIELLRRAGYTLRPIKMRERDSQHKDEIEKIRVPVQFVKQSAADGFYSVSVPGKLYNFGPSLGGAVMEQYADMTNGSYYMVSRLFTNAAVLGQTEADVQRKVDSVLYENIPGKLLSKKPIVKNGYPGYELTNRTRHGDYQRYNIFVTPFELVIFKMSGTGDYVKLGTEAERFFSSVQLKESGAAGWKKFRPGFGGFEVETPAEPMAFRGEDWRWSCYDAANKTAYQIIRKDVHNYNFAEEDSFDLNLMEESFASSDAVQRLLTKKNATAEGYPALDAKYKFNDSSVATVRYLIQGPHYYTLIAKADAETPAMQRFVQSFSIKPFVYSEARKVADSALHFTVKTPVVIEKKKKLSMYPEAALYGGYEGSDDDSLLDGGKYAGKLVENDSTGERIYVSYFKPSAYYFDDGSHEKDTTGVYKEWIVRKKKMDTLADKTTITDVELSGKGSSRLLKMKAIEKKGIGYSLQTETDTLSAPSLFVQSFYESFAPVDTSKGFDAKKKKTDLFFSQFFSADTLLHKKAVKNVGNVTMDETDFVQLKRSIESLGWREKKYLDVKKEFIGKLADMPTNEAADYLKTLYAAAGDTLDLQHTVLETLLRQKTAYAYKTFAALVENDPPVLDATAVASTKSAYAGRKIYGDYAADRDNDDYSDGSFMDNLSDSVQLTAGIYKNLLPLINLEEYEEPLMQLTATLLDSSLIKAKDYEAYLPKLLIEAKQLLKKQVIAEKSKAIEKAQQTDEEKRSYGAYADKEADEGNYKLSLYVSLLMPFWDKNEGVPGIVSRILAGNDKRLKYNTAMELLNYKKPLPDTLLNFFAAADDYRFELYKHLKEEKKLSSFPKAYLNQQALAKSELLQLQSYNKPDTVVFMKKLPLDYKGRGGWVYVFKYKENKTDNNWKLATAGLMPKNEAEYGFNDRDSASKYEYDFTELSSTKLTNDEPEADQLQKLLKRAVNSKHKSAAKFYAEEGRYGDYDYMRMKD